MGRAFVALFAVLAQAAWPCEDIAVISREARYVLLDGDTRRAVALDPGDGRAGLMLAHALYAAGRKDEAIEAYREVMANDDGRHRADEPDQDYRRSAGTLLRSLESDIRAGRHSADSRDGP